MLNKDNLSFVVPAYNEEKLIKQCLQSIEKEAPGCRIYVIDNGSSDQTATIAARHAWVLGERRRGVTRARQSGLEFATTKWVAFIDADTVLPDGWLAAADKELSKPKSVAVSGPLVFYDLMVLSRIFVTLFYVVGKGIHEAIAPMVQGGNCIIDREIFLKAGGFGTHIDFYGEDTETSRRLHKYGKVRFSLAMFCLSSGRRMANEGVVTVGARYVANFFWIWITGRPFTKTYLNHR